MDNINLIRKIAWSFHKTTGLEWDDLFQEAAVSYVIALKKYDPDKSKLSTHLWRCISADLTDYWNKQNLRKMFVYPTDTIEDVPFDPFTLFDSLTKEARVIVDIILKTPSKYIGCPNDSKARLTRILRRRGWDSVRIQQGFKELTLALCS